MRKKQGLLGLVLLLLGLFAGAAGAFGEPRLKAAPLSPAFLAYRESLERRETGSRGVNAAERRMGYVPPPVDLSHLRNADYSAYFAARGRRAALPVSYDLRNESAVTPVRSQYPYDACWAFAALGSIESIRLRDRGAALALSPMHLAYYAYKDPEGFTAPEGENVLNTGGNDFKAMATLARWAGPVLESDLPYGAPPSGLYSFHYPNRLHLRDAYFADIALTERQPWQAANEIGKELILSYGAISVNYCASAESTAYNAEHAAWYNRAAQAIDHTVLAVGWDDDYPRENFNASQRPQGDGAWLIKNSWGTEWGQDGYFWLSYEDASLALGTAYLTEETTNYDNLYDYAPLGICSLLGGDVTAWMANVFTARGSEALKAVSFYTADVNASYEISVYTALKDAGVPTSGTRAFAPQRGSQALAGYHTVELDAPVSLSKGTTFSVVVKMTTPAYNYPIAVETAIDDFSERAVARRGESFFSRDGSEWTDTSLLLFPANVCLKAFTVNTSDSTPGTEGEVVSESASDWIPQIDGAGAASSLAYDVTFTGRIDVTEGEVSGVTVSSMGLSGVRATIDEAHRPDAPAGRIYKTLAIRGSAGDLSAVSLLGVSFTQGGTMHQQTFASPIRLMRDGGSGNESGEGGGGGGGCASAPSALLAAAPLLLLLLRRRA